MNIKWDVVSKDGQARTGLLKTRRGDIETPVFMPVGTLGSVKGIRFESLETTELQAHIILGNAYHLWLRPGTDIVRATRGLHRFIGWKKALLTDSGGFQVWSLDKLRKVSEDGVSFRSHIDGSLRFLSPEVSMEIQAALGSDIVMVFDECVAADATREDVRRSMELTFRWAKRSKEKFSELQRAGLDSGQTEPQDELSGEQSLFGIIQGAIHMDLRKESLARTLELEFDGLAIGGLSVGEEKKVMYEVISEIAPIMPENKPRYLMGVGTPIDLLESVEQGIDMFDCVLPTRTGRNGLAWTSYGKLNIKLARWAYDTRPLDENCACSVCLRHSRSYIRHLYLAGEMLAGILLTHHNLAFYLDTMRRVRQAIRSGEFMRFKREFIEAFTSDHLAVAADN
jgi:queuine tRNA-ribosyltransferase